MNLNLKFIWKIINSRSIKITLNTPGGAGPPLPWCNRSPTPARLQLGGSGQGGLSPVGQVTPSGGGGGDLVGMGSVFPLF